MRHENEITVDYLRGKTLLLTVSVRSWWDRSLLFWALLNLIPSAFSRNCLSVSLLLLSQNP